MFRSVTLSAFFVLASLLATAQAATYHVATSGNDVKGNGSPRKPFATIQKAVDAAASGDTIEVGPGRYTKAAGSTALVTFSGKNHITLVGVPGTILDCSDTTIPSGSEWIDEGNGVYKKSYPKETYGQFAVVTVDDGSGPKQLVTGFSDSALGMAGHMYSPDDKWYWKHLMIAGIDNEHTPEGVYDYWQTLRGLAFHNVGGIDYDFSTEDNDGFLYIHLTDGVNPLNPADYTVKASRRLNGQTIFCGIRLTNDADYITIRGFEFQNGYQAIYIDDSKGSIIEQCRFVAVKRGIMMTGDPSLTWGAEDITIGHNELTASPFSDHVGRRWPYAQQVWTCQKEFGWQDWWMISGWGTLGGHHIHDNYIHEGWDGITLGCDYGDWKNSEADHNLIINCLDDPIDVRGNCENTRIHDNVSINNQSLVRVRATGGSQDKPMFFYNNIMLQGPLTDNSFNFSSGVFGDNKAYFYHNTIDSNAHDKGIFCNQSKEATYDNWWWANNLFLGHQWTKHEPSGADTGFTIDWNADYNVYCLRPGFASWTYPGRVDTNFDPPRNIDTNNHTLWSLNPPRWTKYDPPAACPRDYIQHYDVSLTKESEARGRAADLTELWGFTPPGTLSKDCGALPYGESMPIVPR